MSGELMLGMSKRNTPVGIPLTKAPRMAICGSSGSGKSVLLNNIITQYMSELRDRVRFTCLDPKLTSLAHLAPRLDVYETEPARFLQRIQEFSDKMEQRYAAMRSLGRSSLGADDLDSFPMELLVLEESMSIVQNAEVPPAASKAIMALYTTILTRCRAANMGVIMVSHSFSAECLPTVARDQLVTRVIMQSASSTIVGMLADPEQAPGHLIANPGEFYFIEAVGAAPIRAKTWYTSDEEAHATAVSYAMDKQTDGEVWHVERPF